MFLELLYTKKWNDSFIYFQVSVLNGLYVFSLQNGKTVISSVLKFFLGSDMILFIFFLKFTYCLDRSFIKEPGVLTSLTGLGLSSSSLPQS